MDNSVSKKRSLKKDVLVICSIMIIVPSLILGVLGGVTYYQGVMERYESYLHGLLNYVRVCVDGDDLQKCIETGTPSEKFKTTNKILDEIKETYDVHFLYMVQPVNTENTDNMINVMAGATKEEKQNEGDSLVQLGQSTGDSYTSDVAAEYLKGMTYTDGQVSYFFNITKFGFDYTGMTPIYNSNGEPVCILAADISVDKIKKDLSGYILGIFFEILLLSAIFIALMKKWMDNRLINPITRIKESAAEFIESSRGQSDPNKIEFKDPNVKSGDEMEVLSNSLITMSEDLKKYMSGLLDETRERERIGTELSVATQIQGDMLPRVFPTFNDQKEFDIYATMNPAKEVGGDFYDFFYADDDHLAMVMADVSGKGVPAALFMVIAKTFIKNRIQMSEKLSPGDVLSYVNDQLCEGNEAELFVTVWLGIINIKTGEGIAANAGHEHPAIRRAGGEYELIVYRHSPAVATMEGLPFREHEFKLNPGDSLYVYTDGVPEATNADNVLYGTDRMLEALNEDPTSDMQTLLARVKRSVDDFVGDAPQFDDITMLGLHFNGVNTDKDN